MCNTTEVNGRPALFVSAKSRIGIPVRHPALRDALILASLDPGVWSIDYLASARVASVQVPLDAVIIQDGEGRYVLDVVPAERFRDLEEEGLVLIALEQLKLESRVLTADEMLREPRYTNSKLVWAHKDVTVPIGLRLRVQQVLLDEKGPVPLGQLLKSVAGESNAAEAVMALACANVIRLDLLTQPLSPTTLVRCYTQADHDEL